jgi:serine/threonine protein kinase
MSFIREPDAEPIPGYRLIEPLGTGGFGEVWKCEAPGGIYKAIKFVFGNLNALDSDSSRAEQEFTALNRIKEVRHPFVLSMDRIEVVAGELAIVMELADCNLHDQFIECQSAGLVGIPRDSLLKYIRDAAEALDHMIERHNLQHLDVKPRNLFLISDRVKVADFGLVKHLDRGSGSMSGVTPLYAPPETFRGDISKYSDQYSLAIVYQELLTGQRPFTGKNPRQLALQHTNAEPELRWLPEAERPVVNRALAKDPAKRWPDCMAFVRALVNAQRTTHAEMLVPEPIIVGMESRPKSLADSLEDVFLERPSLIPEASPVVVAADGHDEDDLIDSTPMGITMEQPQTGALRPTLIVGIGAFGKRALAELRYRFLDRFGDLKHIPIMRFLYVDTDPEAIRSATRGAPEVALASEEIHQLPLQPVGNYRRRMLEQISEWLPREKLYSLPRSLQTQGSRALGRLAFADNHLRFMARLRRDIQIITHPDSLFQSVRDTELALRDHRPRVYVIGAAGGGGSGMIADLAYNLRRLMHQLQHPEAEIRAFLFCGAPQDPATPKLEQANVYATLTELNHYADPAVRFSAQYNTDGPRTVENGTPFSQIYLLQLANRSPSALRDTLAHLGSYLFHELTTPLGLRLDRCRRRNPELGKTPFRSFGTHAVWFPRGLLLRHAARKACGRLLGEWQSAEDLSINAEVETDCLEAISDAALEFQAVCTRLEQEAGSAFDGDLPGSLTKFLTALSDQSHQSAAQDSPGGWARQALHRVEEFVGAASDLERDHDWRRSRISRALAGAIPKLAAEWDERLSAVAFALLDHPGCRIAAAEAGFRRFIDFCDQAATAQEQRVDAQFNRSLDCWTRLTQSVDECTQGGGGFSLFGGRTRRSLRSFVDQLSAFGRQRLVEEVMAAGQQFYRALQSKLADRLQELAFCRQRLRHLQERFDKPPDEDQDLAETTTTAVETTSSHSPAPSPEAYWESIRESTTARVLLPDGASDMECSAEEFVSRLNAEDWDRLDQAIQNGLLSELGGLHRACMTGSDLSRHLAGPLIRVAAKCLSGILPETDVADVEFSLAASGHEDIAQQVRACFDKAAPLMESSGGADQAAFLLTPASESGKALADHATRAVQSLEIVRVPGQTDLMFCREQGFLSPEDLKRVLRTCRQAYAERTVSPNTSPHARFDFADWMPLDP